MERSTCNQHYRVPSSLNSNDGDISVSVGSPKESTELALPWMRSDYVTVFKKTINCYHIPNKMTDQSAAQFVSEKRQKCTCSLVV